MRLLEFRTGIWYIAAAPSTAVLQAPGEREICHRAFSVFDDDCQVIIPHSLNEPRQALFGFFQCKNDSIHRSTVSAIDRPFQPTKARISRQFAEGADLDQRRFVACDSDVKFAHARQR